MKDENSQVMVLVPFSIGLERSQCSVHLVSSFQCHKLASALTEVAV